VLLDFGPMRIYYGSSSTTQQKHGEHFFTVVAVYHKDSALATKKATPCGMLVGGTWKMAPAKRPDKVLLFFPWGIMDGGLFITHSVTLSNTSKTCSL